MKHDSFAFGSFNWRGALALGIAWAVTAAGEITVSIEGYGRVTQVSSLACVGSARFPLSRAPYRAFLCKQTCSSTLVRYIIVLILFIRGVTLEGSRVGIDFYLLRPDFSKLAELKVAIHSLLVKEGEGA